MKHYVAGVAVIVRDTDGLRSTRWGLTDTTTGAPVPGDGPPAGWTHPRRPGREPIRMFEFLSDAGIWISRNGGGLLVAGLTTSIHQEGPS